MWIAARVDQPWGGAALLTFGRSEMAMSQTRATSEAKDRSAVQRESARFIQDFHGVRYQVRDVRRAVAFYTEHLGFELEHQHLPEFANVSLGEVSILLSGPGASGSRPMPDGREQGPGGWNRVVLRVSDLPSLIENLREAGLHFRNEMEVGPGGKQIQLEDPEGNAIELFEPAK
jgi:glyoxylase I family protein